jgi:hypothetical protein
MNKQIVLCLIMGFFLLPLGCMGKKQAVKNETPVKFSEIISGNYSGIQDRTFVTILSEDEFVNLWSEVFSSRSPVPEIPHIDFEQEMVIGLFMGTFSTGGYSVFVEEVTETPEQLNIHYRFKTPGKDDMVTMALSQPFQLLIIPRTTKSISFQAYGESPE